jgi:uncharacterized protein YifN (PemK superfamily)
MTDFPLKAEIIHPTSTVLRGMKHFFSGGDMVHSAVPAGTVLFLDFNQLNLAKPEFEGAHPVMVLSPESKQKDGTAIVIPLTSAVTNAHNMGAVEITNESFIRTSPTGRSFAICDKPVTVALSRLQPFRAGRRAGVNYQPNYQIKGEDLANARIAFSVLSTRMMSSGAYSPMARWLACGTS